MKLYKNIFILVAVILLTYFSANQFGNLYVYFFPQPIGGTNLFSLPFSKLAENGFIGLPLAFTFFLTFLFTAFGGGKKYWWIGTLLIPAAIFEVYFDLSHIYFPILLALAGWGLGSIIHKFFRRRI